LERTISYEALFRFLHVLEPRFRYCGGLRQQAKVEKKETVTTPGGTTTTTDEHKVDSSGKNPPANSRGEKAK